MLHSVQILSKYKDVDAGKTIRLNFRVDDITYLNRSNYAIVFDNFRILLSDDQRMSLGDKITVIGKVESRVIGVIFPEYTLKYPSISVVEHFGQNNDLLWFLYIKFRLILGSIRTEFLQIIGNVLSGPQAGLLAGTLLGLKTEISKEFYDNLVRSGTLHIVAASGFNISLVATFVSSLLEKRLNRASRTLVTLVALWFYTFLAGFEPSIVRAAVMATLGLLALQFGREYLASWCLILTGLLMLVVDPILIESIGFWLSITSTWGVLCISPGVVKLIEEHLYKHTRRKVSKTLFMPVFWIKNDLATTLAAQLATLPIIWIVFGRVSLVAPLVNIIVLWLIPLVMVLGSLLILFGALFPPLSYLFGFLAWLPLTFFVKVVYWFGSLSVASVIVGEPLEDGLNFYSFVIILGCYLFLFSAVKLTKIFYKTMHR